MSDRQQNIIEAVRTYSNRLFGFIRKRVGTSEDAEDILQDVWFQLNNVVNLDEISQLSGWLYQVARNRIIDRSRKRSEVALEELVISNAEGDWSLRDILLPDNNTPETVMYREMFWEELFKALAELPENQRNTFIWNELEDKTLQEIADQTGDHLKTVISRKGYAVKHLRRSLGQLYSEFFES